MKQLLFILSLLIACIASAQVDQQTSSVFTQGDLAQRVGTKDGVQMKVGGLATIGDGGGGTFRWDASSTATTVPGKIIQPVISGVPQNGRWILVLQAQESITGLSDSLAALRNRTTTSGSGTALTRSVTTDGSQQDITIPVDSILSVVSVTPTSADGSGAFTFRQSGNNLVLHYAQAPEGTITYKINVLGSSSNSTDTTIVIGGGGGGGNNGGGNTNTTNSLWTYTVDTSCQVNYGALFGLGSSSANMIALANTGLNYARVPYNGSGAASYPSYSAGGYNILLSFNPAPPVMGSYVAITSDSLAFRNSIKSLFTANGTTNVIGGALINEWNNIKHGAGYWNPISAQNTINNLRAGGNALHEMGLKSYDGGVTGDPLFFLVYEDYMTRGFTDSAATFAAKVFPSGTNLTNWRNDTAHGYIVRFTDSVLTAFNALPLDGVNVHFKETVLDSDSTDATIDPQTFKSIVHYLHRKTGKPVITNEFGTNNNTNADILSQLIDAIEDLHDAKNGDMSIAIWYNYGLANSDGSLTAFGTSLKNKIAETRIAQ